jgi:hypothetical protein
MLKIDEVNQVVIRAVSASLVNESVILSRVISQPTTDSVGHDALNVTIVFSDASQELNGRGAVDIIVRVQRELENAGDERFPIIEFATEDEMASNVDPEA